MISEKAKPFTRSEFEEFAEHHLIPEVAESFRATIEAGRFAPELTEEQLHAWLWTAGGRGPQRPFDTDDLGMALHALNEAGKGVEVWNACNSGWVVATGNKDEMFECRDLATVARTVTGLAYREAHAHADVAHLLGDDEDQA